MTRAQPVMPGNPFDAAPVTRRQFGVLATIILLAALDGYDALAMAFVAPVLRQDWQLGQGVLGILLSSGLAGMAIGALFLSPVADRVGRRSLVLGCLALMGVSSLLSAVSTTVAMLAASRVLTGVGIGAMIVMTTLLSAEFSNAKRRPVAVAAIATIGFPIGAVLGGLMASALLRSVGWQSVFVAGGIFGLVLLVLAAAMLPESPVYLIARRSAGALPQVNRVLARLNHPTVADLPTADTRPRVRYMTLFAPAVRATTFRLIAVNLLVATSAYYIINWLPLLVADAGFAPATGSFVSAISGLIGLFGGITMGVIASRFSPIRLATITMAGMAALLAVIGFVPPVLVLFILAAGFCSFFASGTTGLFYGILAVSFASRMRASGIGLVMGVGRITSAGAPALAGWLFANGLTRGEVSLAFAAGPLAAALLMARFVPAVPDEGAL